MAGTLSAAITPVTAQQFGTAALTATGALDTAAFKAIVSFEAAFSAAGGLASPLATFAQRPADLIGNGTLTITATWTQLYPYAYNETASGKLTATGYNNFVPSTVTTTRSTGAIPIGTKGCYVTLTGGGGNGGAGYGSSFEIRGGGAGGGAGGRVLRSYIARSQLGTTYSCIKGGNGQASSFTSGAKTVSANAGGNGGTGLPTNAGGVGGTVTNTGFTGLSTASGGGGGVGGSGTGNIDGNVGNSTNGGGSGGGGGAFTNYPGAAGNGTGGAGGNGFFASNGNNGFAGGIGGGGGGGGGGNPTAGQGGAGGPGDLIIEWV